MTNAALPREQGAGRENDKQPNAGRCIRFRAAKSLGERQLRFICIFLHHSSYPANVIHMLCREAREPAVEWETAWKHRLLRCCALTLPHAFVPMLKNRTGLSGEAVRGSPVQVGPSSCPAGVWAEERTFPTPGCLLPAALLVPSWRVCQQGAVQP